MRTKRFTTWLSNSSAADGGGVTPALAVGSFVAVLASAVASVLAYGVVSDPVRIRWTAEMGTYYGPEFAPAAVVLAAFPLAVAGLAAGAVWLRARFGDSDEFAPIRPYYTPAVLGTLAVVVATQAGVILANLG